MLDRTLAPPFVKSTSFHLPEVTRAELSNRIRLLHLNNVRQHIVKIEIVYNAGKWFESKPEVSHFTVQMLDKGTKTKTSAEIAEYFDRYGAHIELSSNFDFATVSLYSPAQYLTTLYPVFLELVTSPAFAEDELIQMKDHFIQGLRIKNEKTSYLASKFIRKKIFGSSHPYGHTIEEVEVIKIERGDLNSFFKLRFTPTHVFIIGQIGDLELNQLCNDLSSFDTSSTSTPTYDIKQQGVTSDVIEKSQSVQSSIRLGKRSIQRDHPDYPGLLLLNYYLGGFFGSRLMKNLREEKGLTYGISSSINPFKYDSALLIGTDVNKENRSLAVEEIIKEIKLLQSSLNAEDLELSKRHFIGSLQGEIASPFSIMEKIKNIELFQLPDNYYQNMVNAIENTTPDELSVLAKKHVSEGSFLQVTVG